MGAGIGAGTGVGAGIGAGAGTGFDVGAVEVPVRHWRQESMGRLSQSFHVVWLGWALDDRVDEGEGDGGEALGNGNKSCSADDGGARGASVKEADADVNRSASSASSASNGSTTSGNSNCLGATAARCSNARTAVLLRRSRMATGGVALSSDAARA